MLEQGIREILSGDATVANLTGGRIRPIIGAQLDARPFLVFSITAGSPIMHSRGPTDHSKGSVEIAVYADTQLACIQLGNEVVRLLGGVRNITTTCRIVSHQEDQSDVEQAIEPGKETPIYVRTQSFNVLYKNL